MAAPPPAARQRWHLIAIPLAVTGVPLLGGLYWTQRSHAIVYRASATECEYQVRYATHEAETGPLRVRDRWETPVISLVHGDVANLIVTAGPGCALVRCELEEDGRVVARSEGTAAAICSAATAR